MIPFIGMINYCLLRMNMYTMFTIVTLMVYTNRHCVMRTVLYIRLSLIHIFYGGTYNLLAHTLPTYGVTATFVDPSDPVSYTHLDVYKRQGCILADCGTSVRKFLCCLHTG